MQHTAAPLSARADANANAVTGRAGLSPRELPEATRPTSGRASAPEAGILVRVGPDETHGAAVDALGALLEPGQVVRGA